MAERRVNCVAECPHEEKIAAVYEKVITGNGDFPLPERVRKLEDKMEEVLPDLKKLVAASERAEGVEDDASGNRGVWHFKATHFVATRMRW